jgi:hypothetical protein
MESLKNSESDGDITDTEDHQEFAEQSKKFIAKLNKKLKGFLGEEG